MKTTILKSPEIKALKLGIGLSATYLAVAILITGYCGTTFKQRPSFKTNPASKEKTLVKRVDTRNYRLPVKIN